MSAATILTTALQMTRQAISRADSHPQRAMDGLRELEKYLEGQVSEFTPVQHAVAARKLRESTDGFKAVNVTAELEKGQAAVARITTASKRKSLPPKRAT